jgi:gluconolactonase
MQRYAALGAIAVVVGCSAEGASVAPSGSPEESGIGDERGALGDEAESTMGSENFEGGNEVSSPESDARARADAVCPDGATYPTPLGANRTATLVRGGFHFCEGPVWVAGQSALFFSDMDMLAPDANHVPPSTIHRMTLPGGTIDDFIVGSGSNGLALDVDGNILAATHDIQSLSRYDLASRARVKLALSYMGQTFNSPNDLAVRRDGTVYFSDPDWQRGTRPAAIDATAVYRLSAGTEVTRVAALNEPNGIALSPDQTVLYVDDADNEVLRFPLSADGSAGTPTKLASLPTPDGMAVDCAGNLYVSTAFQGTVEVIDPAGRSLGAIQVPGQVTNAAFGGTAQRTLFITSGDSLYSIELEVPGLPY